MSSRGIDSHFGFTELNSLRLLRPLTLDVNVFVRRQPSRLTNTFMQIDSGSIRKD